MSVESQRPQEEENLVPSAQRSPTSRAVPMQFRIVGPHEHQAVLGTRIFSCKRETVVTDDILSIRWRVFDGKICLQADCRTLNAAKKLCRDAARGEARAIVKDEPPSAQTVAKGSAPLPRH